MKAASSRLKAQDSRRVVAGTGRSDKRSDPFYHTREYKQWREVVIALSGGRCQDPAHEPARPREGITLFADHVVELKDGGAPYDPFNGMARCGACHTTKTLGERARRMQG